MIHVQGSILGPTGNPMEYTSLLVQSIKGSAQVLPEVFAYIQLDATGSYDFNLLEGTYRIYANYATSKRIDVLGECYVSSLVPSTITLNTLLHDYPVNKPDSGEVDDKWQEMFDKLVEDVSAQLELVKASVSDGDEQTKQYATQYTNTAIELSQRSLEGSIEASLNTAKRYTDATAVNLNKGIDTANTLAVTTSNSLNSFKGSTATQMNQINKRIDDVTLSIPEQVEVKVLVETAKLEERLSDIIAGESTASTIAYVTGSSATNFPSAIFPRLLTLLPLMEVKTFTTAVDEPDKEVSVSVSATINGTTYTDTQVATVGNGSRVTLVASLNITPVEIPANTLITVSTSKVGTILLLKK